MWLTNYRGYFKADGQKFANRSNLLFPKRAILNVGMLLRDSAVAKEVRNRLLDIVHDAEAVKAIIFNHKDELTLNGLQNLAGREIKEVC